MTLTRRQLLRTGAAAVAVAGTPMLRGLPARAAGSAALATELTQAAFTAQIGTAFRVPVTPSRIVAVRLDSVTPLPRSGPPAPAPSGEGFSLLFVGSAASAFPQGRYLLRHRRLGRVDLLLVPVDQARDGRRYEAVVNRLW